jgi:YbgC/YbaW family acyl-CoA thioester hydrolase
MVGFSLGAAIAMLLTQLVSCRALALLSPTLNLVNDFTAFLGQSIMDKLSQCNQFVEVDLLWRKIRIGRKFYASLFQQKPLDAIKNYKGAVFCIAGENDFSAENAHDIYMSSPSPTKFIDIVSNADHIFSLANGDNELFLSAAEAILWLQKNLALPMSMDNVHIWHSEVKPQEIDIQNIVNNSYYLHYFDQARIQFLLSKGVDWEMWHKNGYNFVLVHTDMNLKFSLKTKNQFYVASAIERLGRLKILFKQKIFRKSDNKLVAEALNTVVCVSVKNAKPVFSVELEALLFPKRKDCIDLLG